MHSGGVSIRLPRYLATDRSEAVTVMLLNLVGEERTKYFAIDYILFCSFCLDGFLLPLDA